MPNLLKNYSPLSRPDSLQRNQSIASSRPLSRESPLARCSVGLVSANAKTNRSVSVATTSKRPLFLFGGSGSSRGSVTSFSKPRKMSGSVSQWVNNRRQSQSQSNHKNPLIKSQNVKRPMDTQNIRLTPIDGSPNNSIKITNQNSNRRILPSGAVGARLVADILRMEDIVRVYKF